MTTWYIDPTWTGTASGTFAQPYTSPSSATLAYGDKVLFKEQTQWNGSWTVGSISGTSSENNRLTIGTYHAVTGVQLVDFNRMASINCTNASTDPILISSKNYITVDGLYLKGWGNFPNAGLRVVDSSYVTIQNCRLKSLNSTGGAYGIRFDNSTGSGATRTGWKILNNVIERVPGNAGIIIVWSSVSGEYVTDIQIKNNLISGLIKTGGATPHAIHIVGRAGVFYTDPAGFKAKGLQITDNIIISPPAYGITIDGVQEGGTLYNLIARNQLYNIGDGNTDAHCISCKACENFIIEDNYIEGSNAYTGQTFGTGVGIFIDMPTDTNDGSQDMIVRRNLIRNTGRGGTLNDEVGGAGIMVFMSQRVQVYGNVIDTCSNGIVTIGWYGTGNKSANVNISNNTVVNSKETGYYICKAADTIVLKNNISYGGKRGYYIENTGATPITNYSETYNVSYGATLFNWCGGDEPTASSATISTRTPDASCQTVDPIFVNSKFPWYGLSSSSSILAAGTYLDISDYSGKRFANPPSIGATQNFTDRSVSNRTVTLIRGVRV